MKPEYTKNFADSPDDLFDKMMRLDWLTVKDARREYFMSNRARAYAYGNKDFEYQSRRFTEAVAELMKSLGDDYNVCFLNRYDEARNALGWHADDSPEMDSSHPIAVVSLGAAREIWWKENDFKGVIPVENRQLLAPGSLFVMPAGFQQKYMHRIPKSDRACGARISLTFRRYV